jgi:hypothetical protein
MNLRLVGRDVLFAHWPVDPESLGEWLHPDLAVDTYDGDGWVGVLAFEVAAAGLASPFPAAPQVHLRTYVTHDGEPGVHFVSCDTARRLARVLAGLPFGLPFRAASVDLRRRGERVVVRSRSASGGRFDARYRPVGEAEPAAPDSRPAFLAERHRYFSPAPDGGVIAGTVERDPWRLAPAEAEIETNTLFEAVGLSPPSASPAYEYSPRFEPRFVGTERLAPRER